jgi:hypothetical protein
VSWGRRAALGSGLAAVAAVGLWSAGEPGPGEVPSPRSSRPRRPELIEGLALELGGVRSRDVPAWLHRNAQQGVDDATILVAAMVAGVLHGAADGDLHHLLISGPSLRLAASAEQRRRVTLWVLLQASEWIEFGTGAAPATRAEETTSRDAWLAALDAGDPDELAARTAGLDATQLAWLGLQVADPHPMLLAAECVELDLPPGLRAALLATVGRKLAGADPERNELSRAVREAAQALEPRADRRPGVADEIAELIRTASMSAALDGLIASCQRADTSSVWEGVWLAAAAAAGPGGAINATHAITATWAAQRLGAAAGDPLADWHAALCAAMRLVLDGPAGTRAPAEALGGTAAWSARAHTLSADPHDLKVSEAVLGMATTLPTEPAGRILGLLAGHERLQGSSTGVSSGGPTPWGALTLAEEELADLGGNEVFRGGASVGP